MNKENRALRRKARRGRNFGINVKAMRTSRLILFAILAIPMLALAVLAGKFVSMPVMQAYALSAYGKEDYVATGKRADALETANYFESYLPSLTRGTALLKNGDMQGAQKELETSLEIWNNSTDLNKPPHAECKIRNNLAIAVATEANQTQDLAKRAEQLRKAEEVLAPCMSGGSSEQNNEDKGSTGQSGEKIQKQREKAEEESGQGQDGQNQEGSEGKDDENQKPEEKPQDSEKGGKSEELSPEEKAEQQRQEELNKRNNGEETEENGGEGGKETKPW